MSCTECDAPPEFTVRLRYRDVTIATMELQLVCLVPWLNYISMTLVGQQYNLLVAR